MATMTTTGESATTTSSNGHVHGETLSHPAGNSTSASGRTSPATRKYLHVAAVHSKLRTSCLSHDSATSPSFLGFRNLMVLVLIVMNLRLVVENFMKYGNLICVRCHGYQRSDLLLGFLLYALVPCHLFVAYVIEVAAATQAKGALGRAKRQDERDVNVIRLARRVRATWTLIAFAHAINATLALSITTLTVFWFIHHPMIGTISELHAIILWLKICSYAFTNRDLRHALLRPDAAGPLPDMYKDAPYPRNITVGNLTYFWWAPTLVYQPVYPRTPKIRWTFVGKRFAETVILSIFIWLASAQYAAPLLHNSLAKMSSLDLASIVERLMKLSTISLVIWLAGFFASFQSALNGLAELMRFGDREFYTEWWNSPSVGAYWRTWNKPMYQFMRRHVHGPLIARGWSSHAASIGVFVFSGVLHELLVGIPTHNILGVAFIGMLVQIPLMLATTPLERMQGLNGKILGNCIFWISFCLVGQPLAALLYFFAWQAKYGSVSKQKLLR